MPCKDIVEVVEIVSSVWGLKREWDSTPWCTEKRVDEGKLVFW